MCVSVPCERSRPQFRHMSVSASSTRTLTGTLRRGPFAIWDSGSKIAVRHRFRRRWACSASRHGIHPAPVKSQSCELSAAIGVDAIPNWCRWIIFSGSSHSFELSRSAFPSAISLDLSLSGAIPHGWSSEYEQNWLKRPVIIQMPAVTYNTFDQAEIEFWNCQMVSSTSPMYAEMSQDKENIAIASVGGG